MEPSEHEEADDDVREATLAGGRGGDAPPIGCCGGEETSENEDVGVPDGLGIAAHGDIISQQLSISECV
jgi:hypothetical protein